MWSSSVLSGGWVPHPGTHGDFVIGFMPSLQPETSALLLQGVLTGGGHDVALPQVKVSLKKMSVRHQHCRVPFAYGLPETWKA